MHVINNAKGKLTSFTYSSVVKIPFRENGEDLSVKGVK